MAGLRNGVLTRTTLRSLPASPPTRTSLAPVLELTLPTTLFQNNFCSVVCCGQTSLDHYTRVTCAARTCGGWTSSCRVPLVLLYFHLLRTIAPRNNAVANLLPRANIFGCAPHLLARRTVDAPYTPSCRRQNTSLASTTRAACRGYRPTTAHHSGTALPAPGLRLRMCRTCRILRVAFSRRTPDGQADAPRDLPFRAISGR